MKTFEEMIRSRLEGCESSLPEGDLAEFGKKLDKAEGRPAKRKGAYPAWLIPLAAAAGLALFLMPRNDRGQEQALEISASIPVAEVPEPAYFTVPESFDQEEPVLDNAIQKSSSPAAAKPAENANPAENAKQAESTGPAGDITAPVANEAPSENPVPEGNADPASPAPAFSSNGPADAYKPVSIKVGKASAAIAGTAGAVALAGALPSLLKSVINADAEPDHHYAEPAPDFEPSPAPPTPPSPPEDKRNGKDSHRMPLRTGLSLRIPLNDRWSLTTGLGYSLYTSHLGYTVSPDKRQEAHYLEFPVRADYTLAKNRWLDVYIGAGAAADFCIAATLDGARTEHDGTGVSLVGAGGIQFNATDRIGLFIDPSLSWDLMSGYRTLDTYRSGHPLLFSVSGGVRFTFRK